MFGVWRLFERQVATNNPRPKIETQVITRVIEGPGETSLEDACAEYEVGPYYPERLAIPVIDVSGCIERVGLDEKGAIAVPSSIYTAGWYVNSVLPGQPGLSSSTAISVGITTQTASSKCYTSFVPAMNLL